MCRGCHRIAEFRYERKLTNTGEIAYQFSKRAASKRGGRVSKPDRKKFRPKCLCCGIKRKRLGRNDICMACYKQGRAAAFAAANPDIIPNWINGTASTDTAKANRHSQQTEESLGSKCPGEAPKETDLAPTSDR